VLGAWLIVVGSITIAGSFAARAILPEWWLLLVIGLRGSAARCARARNSSATLGALVTVGGIWAVAVGVLRIVLVVRAQGPAGGRRPGAGQAGRARSLTPMGASS